MGHGLTRRVGIVACGRAATTLSFFAVLYILTRAWSTQDFGLFSAVWLFGNTLVPVFLVGLPTALLYFFPQAGPAGQRRLVLRAALSLVASGGLLGLLLYCAVPHLPTVLQLLHVETTVEDVDWAPLLYPFIPYFFSLVAGGFAESSLVAAGRVSWQAGLALASALGLVAVAAAGAFCTGTVSQVAGGLSAMGLLRMLAAYAMVSRAVGSRSTEMPTSAGNSRGASIGELVSYSIPIAMNDTVGAISRSVDRFVILFFFSAERFGVYYVGAVEVPISLLLTAVVTVVIPEVSRLYGDGHLDQITALWKQAVGRLSLMTIPLFFYLFAHAGPIIALWLPSEYAEAEWVFRIFLLALPLRCAIYNPLLVGMGKASWALWGGVGDLVCNAMLSVASVLLLLAWAPEWGILGPALATVFSTYVQVAVLVTLIGRSLRCRLRDLMPWTQFLTTGAISAGAAAVSLPLSLTVEQPAVQLIIGTLSFAAVVAAASRLHRGQREEVGRLVAALRRSSGGGGG